jgi:hypothetical protein
MHKKKKIKMYGNIIEAYSCRVSCPSPNELQANLIIIIMSHSVIQPSNSYAFFFFFHLLICSYIDLPRAKSPGLRP